MTTPLRRLSRGTARLASRLTTPLLPEDYLGLVNPLWSATDPCGRIVGVRPETADCVSLLIKPGRGWLGHRAGQWVRLGIDIGGVRYNRTFSLSDAPGRPDGVLRLTVKANPDGIVSRHLVHGDVHGSIVRLSPADGDFTLPDPVPDKLLFVTAGSGITPVIAILRDLAHRATRSTHQNPPQPPTTRTSGHSLSQARQTGTGKTGDASGGTRDEGGERSGGGERGECVGGGVSGSGRWVPDVVVVHSAPSAGEAVLGGELRTLALRHPWIRLYERHTRSQGRFEMARDLDAVCPDWRERPTWVCGPAGLLDDAIEHWKHAPEMLHVERFRPMPVRGGGAGGEVSFTASGVVAEADGTTPLLEVGEAAGVLMPSGCRMGICFTCVCRLASGRVRDLRSGEEHGEEGELVQTCVSAAAGPVALEV